MSPSAQQYRLETTISNYLFSNIIIYCPFHLIIPQSYFPLKFLLTPLQRQNPML